MLSQSWYLSVLPTLPILLAHLAGTIVAIVLLVRRKSPAAILALIGFGILFILDLASLGQGALLRALIDLAGIGNFAAVGTGVGCCCSIIDVIATVCLIVAIWQAVSGTGAQKCTEGPEGSEDQPESSE